MKEESDDSMPNAYAETKRANPKVEDDDDAENETVESDIEFDGEVIESDNDPPQKMGDPSVDVSEENRDAAQMLKAKAVDAISEGSLKLYSDRNFCSSKSRFCERLQSTRNGKGMLDRWEEAVTDLHIASKLAHDEEIHSVFQKAASHYKEG